MTAMERLITRLQALPTLGHDGMHNDGMDDDVQSSPSMLSGDTSAVADRSPSMETHRADLDSGLGLSAMTGVQPLLLPAMQPSMEADAEKATLFESIEDRFSRPMYASAISEVLAEVEAKGLAEALDGARKAAADSTDGHLRGHYLRMVEVMGLVDLSELGND